MCSTRNVEQAQALGADHVIDYTREDFTQGNRRYDLVLDVAGSRSWSEVKRVLQPHATIVLVGAPRGGRLLGPLSHVMAMRARSLLGSRKLVFFIAKLTRDDLDVLRGMLVERTITPLIDRRYPLDEIADALRYIGEGHCRSKIVVTM